MSNHPGQLLMLFVPNVFITTGPVPLEELGSNPMDSLFQETSVSLFTEKSLQ